MAEQVEIKGLTEFRKTLRKLPKELQKRELRAGLRKGAKVIRDAAESFAPVDSGNLRDHIVIRSEKKRYLNDAARLKVGVATKRPKKGEKSGTPFYWRFLEFGTSKMRAQPFLVPAFEMFKGLAFSEIQKHYIKALPRIARKVKAK